MTDEYAIKLAAHVKIAIGKSKHAYRAAMEDIKPSNPQSPTYQKDLALWTKMYNLPDEAESRALEDLEHDAEFERFKKEVQSTTQKPEQKPVPKPESKPKATKAKK